MYNWEISEELQNNLEKLSKKDKSTYEQILKKINEITNCYDIEYYKNLKYGMKNSKRVHVGHFVLIFEYKKDKNTIYFHDFDHHDNIYKK